MLKYIRICNLKHGSNLLIPFLTLDCGCMPLLLQWPVDDVDGVLLMQRIFASAYSFVDMDYLVAKNTMSRLITLFAPLRRL
jgi:hypothetical protein